MSRPLDPVELVDLVREYNPHTDEALINRAYVFGAKAHAHHRRANGEPYWGHPVAVAGILTELRLDDASIVTALLHDTVEDADDVTHDDIERLFGASISRLVDGVTKLTQLELTSQEKETQQAENFRKLLLAMAEDVRVLLVKLADRLHNMRTINNLKPEKRSRIARETMEIFAPLAGRMGMQSIRDELEDISFQVLNPDGRLSIMRRFLTLKKQTGDLIPTIVGAIEQVLYEAGVPARVEGREKRPHAIWRKMEEKRISFEHLSDIYGFRIIAENQDACYRALGAVHQNWRVVPGRFKDYISGPKANGYRSLHTTVIGPQSMRVEIQIRTPDMHEVAETGVAAHWRYKDGERVRNPFAVDPFDWLRSLIDRLEKGDNPKEFLENVRLEMFHDQVFCFTPKGEVIGLPRGATPIDFAYAIHTRIGDTTVGAKIDGRRRPLWTKLRNGQTVEILRSEAQRPAAIWEDMAFTGKAKSAIRRAQRDMRREEHERLGEQIARHAFRRVGKRATTKALTIAATKLGQANANELLASLGDGSILSDHVVRSVYPEIPKETSAETYGGDAAANGQMVLGVKRGVATHLAPCCQPIPDERIVGIFAADGGVEVHAIYCPKLEGLEDSLDRWLDLKWEPDAAANSDHPARVELILANEPGALSTVSGLIGERQANIDNVSIYDRKPDFVKMRIDLAVRDVKHLDGILTALNAQPIVSEATRGRGGDASG